MLNSNTKVAVIGCGRWGSFLAWYCSELNHDVSLVGRINSPTFEKLKLTRKNEYVKIPDSITLTDDLPRAVSRADSVIFSVPSQNFRQTITAAAPFLAGKTVLLCMKGIEVATGKRLSEVAIECGVAPEQVAVWVGPGHIQEFVCHKPNCMLIDSYKRTTTDKVIETFKSPLIRFYYGNDIVGSEVGAAAKNVMGIVAGVLDGLNLSTLKGALMARGSREVARLINAMGGNQLSAYGLCHLGDYETTLFSPFSHNRAWGEAYVKGEKFALLAEGVYTARALKILAQDYDVDMPITCAVDEAVTENTPPFELIDRLFNRTLKREF